MIHLLDVEGKELQVCRSRAGDANRWALGWMADADVVILQSSDVGPMAFEIAAGGLKELSPVKQDMKSRAEFLNAEKYGNQNKRTSPDRKSAGAASGR